MLEELIKEKQKLIDQEIEEYKKIIYRIEKQKIFLEMLKNAHELSISQINDIKQKITAEEKNILPYRKFNIFQRIFSRKYREYQKRKNISEKQRNNNQKLIDKKTKKVKSIEEQIQIVNREIEELNYKQNTFDINALRAIQKKLNEAQNLLKAEEKQDEIVRILQNADIIIEKRNITKPKNVSEKLRYKLSDNMGYLEIKKIDKIWQDMQEAQKNSAIKGVYTVEYAVNGKNSRQSYIDSQNLMIAIMIRTNKNGEKEFAILPKENLTIRNNKSQLKTTWEVPNFKVADIDNPNQELKEKLNEVGYRLKNSTILDGGKTPVCQSFSNQLANFMVLEVEKNNKNKKDNLNWIDLNYMDSFFNLQQEKSDCVSSEATIYAFLAFMNKYGNNRNGYNNLVLENPKMKPNKIANQRNIFMNSPRFQVVEVETEQGEKDIIAKTKNSITAIYYKVENGKTMIGLQKQVRSPFLTDDKYKGVLLEVIGGMQEKNENGLDIVIRETMEESGYEIEKEDCKLMLGGGCLVTSDAEEITEIYKVNVTGKERKDMKLDDDGEFISNKIDWQSLTYIMDNIQELRAPLSTKIAILLLNRGLERELKKHEIGVLEI